MQAIGSRANDGRVTIVAWDGTVDVSKAAGDPLLDRSVVLGLTGLTAGRYRLRHRRVDATHSNFVASWAEIGDGADWPDEDGWAQVAAQDHLDDLEPERLVSSDDRAIKVAFELPIPSVSLIEPTPP